MPLFKQDKKPVIKPASFGAEISSLRPGNVVKTPPCNVGCPSEIDIRGWVTTIAQAEEYGQTHEEAYESAWRTITDRSPFPAVCGRVCPHPCEDACNRKDKDSAVAINALERFVGDFGIERGLSLGRLTEATYPERVAVVGAGPAGLSCAYQLARRGYSVTVFEAFSQPGGMLRYGIPAYRLPRDVLDAEIQKIVDLGVELRCNTTIGKDIDLAELRQQYQAIFVGIGAHKGLKLGIPGEDAPNVLTGTDFLNRVNRGVPVDVGDHVVVVGGGDTAVDAARVSRRLGTDAALVSRRLGASVTLVYRRTRQEMPAIAPEVEGAIEEGVRIEFLVVPVAVLKTGGKASALRCIRTQLGEPDASGRRRPLPIPGTEFDLPVSTIIAAVSQEPDLDGLAVLSQEGNKIQSDQWGATGLDGVYTGGDDVRIGLAIIAISQGRLAAEAIDARFRGRAPELPAAPPVITSERVKLGWYPDARRHERVHVPVAGRNMETEIVQGLSEQDVFDEAKRCMSCGMCMDCGLCWSYCASSCFEKLPKGQHYAIKLGLCNGCQKCAQECPCGYIDMA